MGDPLLQIEQVRVQYDATTPPALNGIDLEVAAGAQVALVGGNGAGKSTLLKAIAGLVPLRTGRILIDGHPPGAQRERVAYLPQSAELDWRFPVSVRRLVLTGRYVHLGWLRRPSRSDALLVQESLDRLGVERLAERQIGQLSGGQRQRVLLARTLVQQADVLLLDEPFRAVDAESREVLLRVLHDLRDDGRTVLIATHELDWLDLQPDCAVQLHDGRIVPSPTPVVRG